MDSEICVFCIDGLIKCGDHGGKPTNLWQDGIEEIGDTTLPGITHKYVVPSLSVVWFRGIEGSVAEIAVGKLGDPSVYKVVIIVREGTIGHSLVTEY